MFDNGPEHPNFSELSRLTGISRQTLSKRWHSRDKPLESKGTIRKGKYDEFEDEIRGKFTKSSNISAVFHYFQNKYPDIFVSYEGFRYYCQHRGMVSKKSGPLAHVRFETDFGEQVQVDWKEDIKIITSQGEIIQFNLYVMVFSASRKRFMCIAFQKTTEEFFRCTIESLIRAGGCPLSLLTDNMSAIVNHHTNKLLAPVKEFLKDMGFDIQRCKAFHAFTKGKVESVNRFAQWLAPYQGEINDIDDLYKTVRIIERQINLETNATTGFTPDSLFSADQKALKPLPRTAIMKRWLNAKDVSVNNTMLVNYLSSSYSVPKSMIGRTVTLVPCSETLYIYLSKEVIRIHQLSEKKGMHYNPKDYREGLQESMPDMTKDLIEEQARKNLELIEKMERRRSEKHDSRAESHRTKR